MFLNRRTNPTSFLTHEGGSGLGASLPRSLSSCTFGAEVGPGAEGAALRGLESGPAGSELLEKVLSWELNHHPPKVRAGLARASDTDGNALLTLADRVAGGAALGGGADETALEGLTAGSAWGDEGREGMSIPIVKDTSAASTSSHTTISSLTFR